MNNHTPTPWKEARYSDPDGTIFIAAAGRHSIATLHSTGPDDEANAAFIVRAVNAYERDQEIIRAFADYDCEQPDGIGCERFDEKYGAGSPTCWPCKARQAVAKAEGK